MHLCNLNIKHTPCRKVCDGLEQMNNMSFHTNQNILSQKHLQVVDYVQQS